MNKMTLTSLFAVSALISTMTAADDRFANVKIESQHLGGSVYMLQGSGGNIGVSAGTDGLLIIDDQYEPLAQRISDVLDETKKGDLKYIINTHYHGDHTGSNAWMTTKRNATIFAHENVRVRLLGDEKLPATALPVITYSDGINVYINGETLNVIHLPNGHTDGDSVIYFEQANVLHAGDLFFNGMFPYIDLDAGGDVLGYVRNIEKLLAMISDDTKIIPGHGKLGTKTELQNVVTMIKATRQYVRDLKDKGVSVDDIINKGLDEKWQSWSWAFINEEKWIKTLYQ